MCRPPSGLSQNTPPRGSGCDFGLTSSTAHHLCGSLTFRVVRVRPLPALLLAFNVHSSAPWEPLMLGVYSSRCDVPTSPSPQPCLQPGRENDVTKWRGLRGRGYLGHPGGPKRGHPQPLKTQRAGLAPPTAQGRRRPAQQPGPLPAPPSRPRTVPADLYCPSGPAPRSPGPCVHGDDAWLAPVVVHWSSHETWLHAQPRPLSCSTVESRLARVTRVLDVGCGCHTASQPACRVVSLCTNSSAGASAGCVRTPFAGLFVCLCTVRSPILFISRAVFSIGL